MNRLALSLLILIAPSLYAQDSKHQIGLMYQYFQNDINNVTATPDTLAVEYSRVLTPKIAAVGSIAIPLSDGEAYETYTFPGTTTEDEYIVSVKSEIQLGLQMHLFEQSEVNFDPYLSLGFSKIETEYEVNTTVNGSLNETLSGTGSSSGFVYGIGFNYHFSGKWGVKAEYIDVAHDDDTNATKYSFGIQRKI